MPKGDPKRIQNAIDSQGGLAQNNLNNQRQRGLEQNQQMWNNYQQGAGRQMQDYGDLMNQFAQIRDRPDITMNQQYKGNVDQALAGYGNFAQTGGFSPQDIQDIRARGIAPTRAIYQRGVDELNRQRGLTGGTNIPAAIARQSRMADAAIGDANVNTNASIAQMVQQGKLAGMGGLGQLGSSQLGLQNNIDQQNLQRLFGAAEGMRSIYGTNPALANVFGNQALQSNQQGIDVEGLQGRLADMIIQGQLGRGKMPSRWDEFGTFARGLSNIGQMAGGIFGGQ